MHIFVAIGRAQTLTEASHQLDMPLFTVSRALKRIEETAHVVLVRRSISGLHLTDLGREYLDACQAALEAHRAAADVLLSGNTEPTGVLHIAAPVTFVQHVLSHVLMDFLKAFPQLKLDLLLFSDVLQAPKVSHDIFLNVGLPNDSGYLFKRFPSIRQGLFASPEYLQSHPCPTHPLELERHNCLGLPPGGKQSTWHLSQATERLSIRPEGCITVLDPATLSHLALGSAGIAVLPRWLAREHIDTGALVEILPDWTLDAAGFYAMYKDRIRPGSKEGAFLSFLASLLGSVNDPRCRGADPQQFFIQKPMNKNTLRRSAEASQARHS